MRLFLASQGLGDHADRLIEMVGDNKKAFVIFNARDFSKPEKRAEVVARDRKYFENDGFEFIELDLRDYFGKRDELQKFIDEEKPDLIFGMGGNYFILRKAFA